MNLKRALPFAIVLLLLGAAVYLLRTRVHFDWATFSAQIRFADPWHILAGVALVYSTYLLRSLRWWLFLGPALAQQQRRISPLALVGPQFIGFTAVGLFGRLADLTRPFLVARRTRLPLASQVAVYTVERMFDLGAAALIFSSALVFTPRNMPHHEVFLRTGPVALGATLAAALFVVAIRVAGARMAETFAKIPRIGSGLAAKVLVFRDGLNTLRSPLDFLMVLGLSLAMWFLIGCSYLQTVHAFPRTPELAGLSFASTMLLMAASIGGSLLQLPILGWFTQIAVTAGAMHTFYGAPIEAATACGGALLFVTFLCIIPTGLVFARVQGISLRDTTRTAEEQALPETPA